MSTIYPNFLNIFICFEIVGCETPLIFANSSCDGWQIPLTEAKQHMADRIPKAPKGYPPIINGTRGYYWLTHLHWTSLVNTWRTQLIGITYRSLSLTLGISLRLTNRYAYCLLIPPISANFGTIILSFAVFIIRLYNSILFRLTYAFQVSNVTQK